MFSPCSAVLRAVWRKPALRLSCIPCSYHAQLNASKPHRATAVWLGQNWIHYHPLPAFLLCLRVSWNLSPKRKNPERIQQKCRTRLPAEEKNAFLGPQWPPAIHTPLVTGSAVHPSNVLWTRRLVYLGPDLWNQQQPHLPVRCGQYDRTSAGPRSVSEDTSQRRSRIDKGVQAQQTTFSPSVTSSAWKDLTNSKESTQSPHTYP